MANASGWQIIDAWAQPVLNGGLLPEVVRLFEQSGSAQLQGALWNQLPATVLGEVCPTGPGNEPAS